MADRWMDDRDRRMRDRDWRRSEQYGRGDYGRDDDYGGRSPEGRSFGSGDDEFGARRTGSERDRVFGERETGENYSRGMTSGGGESYGRGAGGGRPAGYQGRGGGRMGGGRDWQDRDYGGTSPAFRNQDQGAVHGRQWQDRDYGGTSPAFRSQDYTRSGSQDYSQGGRYYGDDERQPIYRQEYGMGGRDYGDAPRGYDAGRGQQGYGAARPAYGGVGAGGTGGYDYDRGYGDGGRRDWDGDERGGMDRAGDFLSRAGQKVASWFRGDDLMDGRPDERRGFREDFGREWRMEDRGHRGRGPKGYKRSDERISDDICERLADDSWLDASNIDVKVDGGEVTLTGTVDNRESKHRAERLVEDISGVTHVQNNLRITSGGLTGSGHGFGDSAVEAQMRRDEPASNGSGGAGGGQSSAGRKTS